MVVDLLMWGAFSDERMDLSFTIAAGSSQRSHSQVRVQRDWWSSFTVLDSEHPQRGGLGSRIYNPHEHCGSVIPQALASLLVATHDSQGYGGGIGTDIHAES
jgi:hypothetical protein